MVRLGGNRERQVNVRIIAASNRDLGVESESGRFRRDLLYRLKVLALELPPLRGRRGDIPLLVAHFLERLQATYGLGARTASAELLATLDAYDWPDAIVRELVRDAAPMSEIGRRLGISRTTLYRKMKEYGLERR